MALGLTSTSAMLDTSCAKLVPPHLVVDEFKGRSCDRAPLPAVCSGTLENGPAPLGAIPIRAHGCVAALRSALDLGIAIVVSVTRTHQSPA